MKIIFSYLIGFILIWVALCLFACNKKKEKVYQIEIWHRYSNKVTEAHFIHGAKIIDEHPRGDAIVYRDIDSNDASGIIDTTIIYIFDKDLYSY